MMLNESELNTIKAFIHFLNNMKDSPLALDCNVIDSNGDVLGMLKLVDDEYQFHFGLKVS